jgi:hypothetical protein
MTMRRQATRWRVLALTILGSVLALFSACGVPTTTGSGGHTYNTGAGQIVAQLFPQPGFVAIGIVAVPTWTLYGDGTVIYRGGPIGAASSQLLTGKLSRSQIGNLLDTVIDQDHFLAISRSTYGKPIPDAGATHLTINADGKSKSVTLQGNPVAGTDQETQNVFAVENALLGTKPDSSSPYVAPGAALLVAARAAAGQGTPTPWPYADVSLDQAYAVSCGVAQVDAGCPSPGPGAHFYGVYGQRGRDVLGLVNSTIFQTQQGQYVYTVLAFPILPDALVQVNGKTQGVLVNGAGRVPLQPAPPANS